MTKPKPGIGKGVLDPAGRAGKFEVARFHPPPDLEPFVAHLWTVRWDLGDAPPHVQRTLPDPAVHLVFERGRSELVGVVSGRFERVIEGAGQVFAAKLHPGALVPLLEGDASRFTDRRVPLAQLFDLDVAAFERRLFDARDDAARVQALTGWLRSLEARPDADATRAGALVQRVRDEPEIRLPSDLASRAQLGLRSLQRLFKRFVGVSPRWVIHRFRLQEAAESLARGDAHLAELAAQLGFADQAHFSRAFKALVGEPPAAYVKRNRP